MRTVYDKLTGKPVLLNSVDARERVAVGLASWAPVVPTASAATPSAETMDAAPAGGEAASSSIAPAGPLPTVPGPEGGEAMTIKELRVALKEAGIAFPSTAPKADLVVLYDARQAGR